LHTIIKSKNLSLQNSKTIFIGLIKKFRAAELGLVILLYIVINLIALR